MSWLDTYAEYDTLIDNIVSSSATQNLIAKQHIRQEEKKRAKHDVHQKKRMINIMNIKLKVALSLVGPEAKGSGCN